MSITTMTFAARDFSARRGARDEHTLQGSVRSEQQSLAEKEPPPEGLRVTVQIENRHHRAIQTGIGPHRVQTQGTPSEDPALVTEEASFLNVLEKMIGRLTVDSGLRQDLMQECRIHLWRIQHQGEHPCQTKSWYLQNCRFHAQHLLSAGRSLDSMKRAREANRVVIDESSDQPLTEELHTNGELFEAISARDIVSTLQRHLKPQERALLEYLADGWMLRDITLKLGLSYPTALKYRRRIAELTIKLGIAAPPSSKEAPPRPGFECFEQKATKRTKTRSKAATKLSHR